MCRPPWEGLQRPQIAAFATPLPMYGRHVLGRINGDLEIAAGAWFSPAIKLFMSLNAAMLRYCGIMAPLNEGAGARERDSTRAVAPRPGSRVGEGAGKARRHCQQRLSCGKRVYFVSILKKLSRITFADGHHGKGRLAPENAHNEGIGRGTQAGTFAAARRDGKVPSCINSLLSHAHINIFSSCLSQKCPELAWLRISGYLRVLSTSRYIRTPGYPSWYLRY